MARVLIVEDEDDVAELVADVLEWEGYSTRRAQGSDALEAVRSFAPDVILLDLMMPVMNGFEVMAHLRHSEEYHAIPVVVMTAMHDAPARAREMGADAYLSKPFDITDLLLAVQSLAPRSRHPDQPQR